MNKKDKAKKKKRVSPYGKEPFDPTNSTNPWLMNNNKKELIKDPATNKELTAKYIWETSGKDRKELLQRVFNYYRNNVSFSDLVSPGFDNDKIKKEFIRLRKCEANKCLTENNEIKNSNSTCTSLLKQFCGEKFYASKSGISKNSKSCKEVYEDDVLFTNVLKNRMGWKSTREDGSDRPYVFAMSDKMVIQGMRSSGLGHTISTFKPVVAKYLYSKYANVGDKVFDFSAGWGARALGAGSIDLEYWGVDPLTSKEINTMMQALDISGKVICGGSESPNTYTEVVKSGNANKFSFAFSSPPYFILEKYSDDVLQSINKFGEYELWLSGFWAETVINVKKYILNKENSIFSFATVNNVAKHDIAKDMVKICENTGYELIEIIPFKTSRSHLSGKRKTGVVGKTTEKVYVFRPKKENVG